MVPSMLSLLLLAVLDNSSAREDPVLPKESVEWTGYSVALHILLPVAGFCILWGRRDLLTRLMLQIDRNCISVFCPSLSQRQKLLKWASENLPSTWSSPSKTLSGGIPDLWKDGSLLCTLINMVVPGACPNPPKHWKKPPIHAQALAYKYLGVTPVFTETDFEGQFSPKQEKKFLLYLQEIQQAMKSHNEENENLNFTSAYLTKGMGLQTGEQYRKTVFYVYSNTTSSNCNNILVYIRGPYGSKGTATIPAFYNLNSIPVLDYSHKFRGASDKIVFKKEARRSFLKSIALDLTSFVNLERKISTNDVQIHVEMENERAKITYIPNNYGIYEINLISNGEIIKGSPFTANIIENRSGRRDSFDSTEKILKELPVIRKKRIVSRYIDCINEKIHLNALEEDTRKKKNIEKATAVVKNQGDLPKSEIPVSESFEKLEKINESCENEVDCLHTDDHLHLVNTEEIQSAEFCEKTKSNFNLVPTVSVTEPEENLDIVKITKNHSEFTYDGNHGDNQKRPDFSIRNSSQTEGKLDFKSSLQIFEKKKSEENRIDVVASIKPFIQNKEPKETLSEYKQPTTSGLENMIGDKNKNNLREIRKTYKNRSSIDSSSEYFSSEDTTETTIIRRNNEDTAASSGNQNRPTSIVSPFLKTTKLLSAKIDEIPVEIEKNEKSHSLCDSNSYFTRETYAPINEEKLETLELLDRTPKQLNEANHENKLIENKIHYFSNLSTDKHTNDQKVSAEYSDSDEFFPNNRVLQKKYVESLKALLMTKINPQPNNTKNFDFINTTNESKSLNKPDDLQDENNNEFRHESPVTSPVCSDHIAQEVKTPVAQSFGNLSLSERRKFFTRQKRTSMPSSNNSSISETETEDVSEQLDGHKYSLRVLTVMDTIKKSTNSHILNRNTSISVPNISKSKHMEDRNYSPDILDRSNDFRSSFLKTREYWKKMSSENCLSTQNSYEREPSNFEVRTLRNSLSYTPDIHRSADDILSMSVNFKTNKLRRYSSLNQKDLEAIDFISIEERKRRLLRDQYEQECLGRRLIQKRFSSSRINHQEAKIQKNQALTEWEHMKRLEKDSFKKPSTVAIPEFPLSDATHKEEVDKIMVKKESQFIRAILFFKNLEQSSSSKRKFNGQQIRKPEIRRRFSLDFQKQHENKPKPGGSLRALKTSEKFSITQIYFDIMSNRRGSFKGSPNRKALSETLASLRTNDNSNQNQQKDSDDGIKYNLFVNKLKTKKKRSIKSVFDIHY